MRTETPKIERVLDAKNTLGETPIWSAAESALYWINCEKPAELLRWDPKSGDMRRWPMPERIGGFVLKEGGGALVVLASGLFDFDFTSAALTLRVPSPFPSHIALHECVCDPTGRFWVGSIDLRMGPDNMTPSGGKLFRLEGKELVPMIDGISCANGLAFSPDGRTLYISDSPVARCDRWDVDPKSGTISNRKTLFDLKQGEGLVDGSTVDSEGGYWATMVFGSALRRYLPDGTLDWDIKLPFEAPTKVAFGGKDWGTLYITSTSDPMGFPTTSPLNGGLFAFAPGVKGIADPLLPR